MAKKDDKNTVSNEKGGSRLITVLISILIVLIWLAVFAGLIRWDVGGLGSKVFRPVLRDVPVINKILPPESEDEEAAHSNYEYTSLKSANARIKELESRLATQGDTTDANSEYIADLEAEVQKLRVYESQQEAFEERVKRFDEEVVFNDNAPEIEEYRSYYEEINEENAADIYKKVLEKLQYSEKAEELASYYSGMDAASAAERLELMSADLSLVCDILENMKEAQAAAILQEMSPEFATQVTKKISLVK